MVDNINIRIIGENHFFFARVRSMADIVLHLCTRSNCHTDTAQKCIQCAIRTSRLQTHQCRYDYRLIVTLEIGRNLKYVETISPIPVKYFRSKPVHLPWVGVLQLPIGQEVLISEVGLLCCCTFCCCTYRRHKHGILSSLYYMYTTACYWDLSSTICKHKNSSPHLFDTI